MIMYFLCSSEGGGKRDKGPADYSKARQHLFHCGEGGGGVEGLKVTVGDGLVRTDREN